MDFRFDWRLVEFDDDGDRVTCRVEHVPTGRVETVEAAYLVGCDGGASTVRRQLGIGYEGTADLASFVSVYFHGKEKVVSSILTGGSL